MGMKEKFMENMMDKMPFGEKKEMMKEMMEKFFAGMTDDEKKEMMREMMGAMMAGGGDKGAMSNPMMGMMGKMMGNKHGQGDFNPMELCKKMMASMGPNRNTETFATAEIQTLFEEWAQQMDSEVLDLVESGKELKIEDMAAQLKISRESLIYFLTRLARQGKIDLKPSMK